MLGDLWALEDNWDGEGAKAPTADLARSAVELSEILRKLNMPPPTRAATTTAGTILFGWDGPVYFEIEAMKPYYAEWMFVDQNGVPTHGTIGSNHKD